LVTGFEGDDERKKLDYLSTRLAMLTRELDFTLFMVSHVNDDGKTRGSRNISKVADLIISLDRNIEAESFEERNKTRLTIRGNRYAGLSGPAGCLVFDPKSFTLSELKVTDEAPSYDPGF
jgi:KaiC/GvpD/RAD55 family RecA-like ATPase